MINSILIANRGEIACRIIRTCRKLGIPTVAVYSDADENALHVKMADEAIHIGQSPSTESYLVIEKIIDAAQRTQVDAIHPCFGFLAENAEFAQACEDANIIFIGPSPKAIEMMGDKLTSKQLADEIGVPTVPAYDIDNPQFPLMIKAVAGGGGKGMRVVRDAHEFEAALESAKYEAQQAFGSDAILLEKVVEQPRHIEIQILGDTHGNLIHLGERECSIQRRHQKIVEESPSPALTSELREQMGTMAVKLGQAVDYHNAGTVEFLLDEDGQFYFLEMNTRIQVEHPVTELITGLDLVEWQIRVAEGEQLPLAQDDVELNGHAIEVRLYAENPANDFFPQTGRIHLWQAPDTVRVDSGIQTGDDVSIYYDPMLAKIIAHGENRQMTIRRLSYALKNTVLLGLTTNLQFLQDILSHTAFQSGELHTHFLEEHFSEWQSNIGDLPTASIAATLIQYHDHPQLQTNTGYWRNNPNAPMQYRFSNDDHERIDVSLTPSTHNQNIVGARHVVPLHTITIGEGVYVVELNQQTINLLVLTINGHRQTLKTVNHDDQWWIQTASGVVKLETLPLLPIPQPSAEAGGSLRAPLPGSVIAVMVEVGEAVSKGQALMKIEAMKMEHTIYTAADGVVEAIYYQTGDIVDVDAQLIKIASA